MKYGIITPIFNEATYLSDFIRSVTEQTHLPSLFVLVDDHSTDESANIAKAYAADYPWINFFSRKSDSVHQIGAKVVETFNYGLSNIRADGLDVIVKLDADLLLPPDYFQRVLEVFQNNPEVGICGGVCAVKKEDGTLQVEKLTDRFHVRGPIKSYRMACFNDIGGLPPLYGWDTLDELLAEYHGWKMHVIPDLKVIHRRPTGTKTPSFRLHRMTGDMFYRLGYSPLIAVIASAKRYRMPPLILSALVTGWGYLQAAITRKDRDVLPDQMKFIRKLRYKRMGMKIRSLFRIKKRKA